MLVSIYRIGVKEMSWVDAFLCYNFFFFSPCRSDVMLWCIFMWCMLEA